VYSASERENPEEKVAIKVINKVKINQQVDKVMNEIEVLKDLDHPHIVKYVEFYENEYNMYLVMEH
jgi:serine/threonine protein kinase